LKYTTIIPLVALGILLVLAASSLPPLRAPDNPIAERLEPYFVENSIEQTATPNLVTSILADYRGYDTFGETTVVFAAGLSCFLLLRRRP
jgi:multicomponent Na+:H+ antiporter subunit B